MTTRNILIAFILNLIFSVIEFIGGSLTGSVAIISDAVHDFGDALSIGISYFLEKKSQKRANASYTYGYARYSVLGAFITTAILVAGSVLVIVGAIDRLFHPVEIDYSGMIWLAVAGVLLNSIAAYITHRGKSLNQKAVNLHMLEDVLGWVVVLIGAIIMRFTDIAMIDSFMSIGVAIFILIGALRNGRSVLDLFLEKTPAGISVKQVSKAIGKIPGVKDVHHVHLWSLDGEETYATLHAVIRPKKGNDKDDPAELFEQLKHEIRESLKPLDVSHVTIELESPSEHCSEETCEASKTPHKTHHGHHHH